MDALIVVESMYGNTRKIADAIAEGIGHARVVGPMGLTDEALDTCDIVIVGGPTNGHGMTRASTRAAAMERVHKPVAGTEIGLRERFAGLMRHKGLIAAAFDTRVDKPKWLTGSAAKGIAKELRTHGCTLVSHPESFLVDGTEGPLRGGEVTRARRWGETLAESFGAHQKAAA